MRWVIDESEKKLFSNLFWKSVWVLLFSLIIMAIILSGCGEEELIDVMPLYGVPNFFPKWSPAGQLVAYEHCGVDSNGIWLVNSDGTNPRLFFLNSGRPSWSPDGSSLVFVRAMDQERNIFTKRIDGDTLSQLTFGGLNDAPNWSPDGNKIAYISDVGDESGNFSTWVLDLSDTSKVDLSIDGPVDWSPDMKYFIYTGSDSKIWRVKTDGSNPEELIKGSIRGCPEYSPDGSAIAFTNRRSGDPLRQVWVMDADGNNPEQLTTDGGESPSWSPDGSKIVYIWCGHIDDPENGALWVMNSDGTNKHQITYSNR
jgi:Tol biopolymer transport system component